MGKPLYLYAGQSIDLQIIHDAWSHPIYMHVSLNYGKLEMFTAMNARKMPFVLAESLDVLDF